MPRNLLLIEDSATQATQFRLHFEGLGYSVATAPSGASGLSYFRELLEQNKLLPNLIVLDYQLPDEDGVVVCQKLKADPRLHPIPVLMYSAENKLRNMSASYQAGADYYVVKGQEGQRTLELLIDSIFVRQARSKRTSTTRTATTAVATKITATTCC